MVRSILSKSSNGQTFMPDYLASLLVFALLVTIFLGIWNTVVQNQAEFNTGEQMRSRALYTTTFLVSTPGYPSDWTSDTVQIVGLAEEDHVLNSSKLDEFDDMTLEKQKELMRTQNFLLNISNSSGTLSLGGSDTVYGTPPTSEAETVVPITRQVLVNKSGNLVEADLVFVAWR